MLSAFSIRLAAVLRWGCHPLWLVNIPWLFGPEAQWKFVFSFFFSSPKVIFKLPLWVNLLNVEDESLRHSAVHLHLTRQVNSTRKFNGYGSRNEWNVAVDPVDHLLR